MNKLEIDQNFQNEQKYESIQTRVDNDVIYNIIFTIQGLGILLYYNHTITSLIYFDIILPKYDLLFVTPFLLLIINFIVSYLFVLFPTNNYSITIIPSQFVFIFIVIQPLVAFIEEIQRIQYFVTLSIIFAGVGGINQAMIFQMTSDVGSNSCKYTQIGTAIGGVISCLINLTIDFFIIDLKMKQIVFQVFASIYQILNLSTQIQIHFDDDINYILKYKSIQRKDNQQDTFIDKNSIKINELRKSFWRSFPNEDADVYSDSTFIMINNEDKHEQVNNKKFVLQMILMLTHMAVTFMVFPSTLLSYQQILANNGGVKQSQQMQSIYNLIIFGVFDVYGRQLTIYDSCVITSKINILILLIRISIAILIQQIQQTQIQIWDFQIQLMIAVFAAGQGWGTTCLFVRGPIKLQDKGQGGLVLGLSLNCGIALGSITATLISLIYPNIVQY